MTMRSDLDALLTNDQGRPLVRLPWWAEADHALADPAVLLLAIRAPRQVCGKTTYAARIAIRHVLTTRGAYVLMLAASEAQAQSIYSRKVRRPIERLLPAVGLDRQRVCITKRSVEFLDFNTKIEVVPTSEATTPGRSVSLLVIDEARDVPDEIFATLIPSILAAKGRVLLVSTPGRPRGFFYRVCSEPPPEARVIVATSEGNPYADPARVGLVGRLLAFVSQAFKARELGGEFAEDDTNMLLPQALIDAAIDDRLGELPASNLPAYAFVDLGRRRDLTSCVVVVRAAPRRPEARDHLVVASIMVWSPKESPTGEVDFAEVREHVGTLPTRFPRLERLLVDEGAEAGSLLPYARAHPQLSLRVQGFQASVSANMDLWSALTARFHEGTISIPRHRRVLDELAALRAEEFALGGRWRVVDSSRRLHRDVSVSLAGAVYAAGEVAPMLSGSLNDYVIIGRHDQPAPFVSAFDQFESGHRGRVLDELGPIEPY